MDIITVILNYFQSSPEINPEKDNWDSNNNLGRSPDLFDGLFRPKRTASTPRYQLLQNAVVKDRQKRRLQTLSNALLNPPVVKSVV